MLYFPLIDTRWPEWVPKLGGKNFRFFEPIFNIADMAISTGVGILLVFNKKAFPERKKLRTNRFSLALPHSLREYHGRQHPQFLEQGQKMISQ